MSFWKKIYKKIIKTQEQDPQKLAQDKYLRKLKKELKKHS